MAGFPHLTSPMRIGNMELRNRIVMPPMVTNYAFEDGSITGRLRAYHAERARGGVGLIIVEASYVHPSGRGFQNEVGIYSDKLIPGLRSLVDVVHAHGAKIAVQLYHGGRQTTSDVTGEPLLAPSPVPDPTKGETPKEMSKDEIDMIVRAFGEAARRAKAAGFDAVEIHGAHGYLINEFLSPYANKRKDEYGGPLENRLRFPLEVVHAVRRAVGPDFPVIYRMSADEKVAGGLTLDETREVARRLEREGINALHVSAGVYESAVWIIQPMAMPHACLADLASGIKSVVKIPVIAVGRINDPDVAEGLIAQGKADLVAMGRQLLTDPETPRKIAEGRVDELRRCIACCQGCIDELFQDHPIGCTVNARAGFEEAFAMAKAPVARKVLVVGGGPAGMEAARVAALRGHQVTLWEKGSSLGGQLPLAATTPEKGEIATFRQFLAREMGRLKVDVRLNKEATLDAIRAEKPDVVVIATGARPARVAAPGADRPNVVMSWDVLSGKATVGRRVAVIGGGLVGCETSEFLAEKGHEVTIIEMLPRVASDVGPLVGALLLDRLAGKGVNIVTGAKLASIGERDVTVEKDGKTETLADFDSVVISVGSSPEDGLAKQLEGAGIDYYVIGDAWRPRRITHAVFEGMRVAHEI
ncbi:MAG: FAD-dependent oxidoreductase [Firmicutes bacterium]|nr:FAD-dependent oxidoreductase [Bacillota bacterium]MDH7496366.1 FAD-dependent oxidoreductase [Bacillota bacterium]